MENETYQIIALLASPFLGAAVGAIGSNFFGFRLFVRQELQKKKFEFLTESYTLLDEANRLKRSDGQQGQCAEQKLHKALAIMIAYGDENLWRELERESHKNQYDLTGILNTIRKQLRSEIGLGKDDTYYFYWLPK